MVDGTLIINWNGRGGKSGMIKYDPEIHEPRTSWDKASIEMVQEKGHELFVDDNGEVWTTDRKIFAGMIRKEEPVC